MDKDYFPTKKIRTNNPDTACRIAKLIALQSAISKSLKKLLNYGVKKADVA